ncbi:MAG: toprim domain-containing protein [Sulfuritalea sp.]|nr:toprim domain-containing protein [Sulfuritalea sp.]
MTSTRSTAGHLDVEEIKRQAKNRWDAILPALAPNLSEAFDRFGKHVACPVHSGKTERNFRAISSARFAQDGAMACNTCGTFADGFAVLQWVNNWSFMEAVKAVDEWLGGTVRILSPEDLAKQEAARTATRQAQAREQRARNLRAQRNLNTAWKGSVSMTDPAAEPARKYLAKRGLHLTRYSGEMRFNPKMSYTDEGGKFKGYHPAILARFRCANGTPGSILRIYITPAGDKLAVPDPKKMMSYNEDVPLTGGAIRLGPVPPIPRILGIAEGLETALAATELDGIICWAAFSAGMLEAFEPPAGVEKVVIYADLDRSNRGYEAALKLIERLWDQGITAGIRMPSGEIPAGMKGVDWLDVLNEQNAAREAPRKAA